ncbi:MAG: BTAD domain-containing putative transcriptional regulator [Trebonia sp.]
MRSHKTIDRGTKVLASELRFELLGPVRAWRGSAELELGSPQQRAVLAALLLARGRHVSVDALIEGLWGERPPRTASGTVRTYVFRLRRCLDLGPSRPDQPTITLVGNGYSLQLGSAILDLAAFEDLVRQGRAARRGGDTARAAGLLRDADALWRGTPLSGITGPYADSQRARLSELQAATAEDRLAMDIESGNHLAAIAELTDLLAAYPLREKLRELLMLALYRSGRQADALTLFEDSRRLLSDELGIDPGPALRDMHQRILRADSRLARPSRPVRVPTAAPLARLPQGRADFTGRADTLAGISQVLTSGLATPVVVIGGLAGIGKTTLAVHAARAALDEFPDGQLYAEFNDQHDVAVDPADVVAAFLRDLGASAIPVTLNERLAAWRAALAGRRMIILLDDVNDAAQVRRLLPVPAGCAVIITSRRRLLDLPGARFFEIGGLRPDEALSLLERLIGAERVAAERAAADRLVAACCYQPLAVRTAAARLTARPGRLIGAMQRQLQEELTQPMVIHSDCLIVEAPLESAYRRLSPGSAFAFRQAAMQEGLEVSVAAVSALLHVPEHMALALLDSLADVHLIQTSSTGAYCFDALAKLYAWRKALVEDGRLRSASAETAADPFSLFRRDSEPVGRGVQRGQGGTAYPEYSRRPRPVDRASSVH